MKKSGKQNLKGYERIQPQVQIICRVILIFFSVTVSAFSADSDSELWEALTSSDHFVLLRHALAPGTGDPPEFTIGQCATQRNLSDAGRQQAAEIGQRFRLNSITEARVYSSQWCRCLETAQLLKLGQVEELAPLNSFFGRYERRESQTAMLRKWLKKQDLDRPVILVTHQVNITALTGVYPDSGELVIMQRTDTGDMRVVGTIGTR